MPDKVQPHISFLLTKKRFAGMIFSHPPSLPIRPNFTMANKKGLFTINLKDGFISWTVTHGFLMFFLYNNKWPSSFTNACIACWDFFWDCISFRELRSGKFSLPDATQRTTQLMSNSQPMSKINQFASYGLAYLGWICSLLLWLLFMIIGRNALAGVLEVYYIQGGFTRRFQAQFADRVWWVITTIIWIILMVVVEEYLRHGVKKRDLLRRIGRVFAPIVILIFIVDLTLAYLVGFETQPWIRWLLLLVELLAGIGLIWLGKKPPTPANSSNNAMVK